MAFDNLRSLTPREVVTVGLGISSALVLGWGLWPRSRSVTSVKGHPSLAAVKRSPAAAYALQIYPESFYPGGHYVNLPMGRMRYWLLGPENGDKVVLIHGFAVPGIVWKGVANLLVDKGFRVLIYDHYGRGHSDAPDTDYTVQLYVTQLALLMQHVGWSQASLVGYSMGGAIAAEFAHRFSWLSSGKVVLIAPAGVLTKRDTNMLSLTTTPLMEYYLTSSLSRFMRRRRLDMSVVPTDLGALCGKVVPAQTAVLPGYQAALISSLIYGPFRNQRDAFIGLSSSKVLILHGKVDLTVPYRCALEINGLARGSNLVTVDDGNHNIPMTHTNIVGSAIIAHLA